MAATAKAGKTPPRARPVPRAIAAAPPPQANGVLRLTSTSDEEEAREPLFYIDDVEYTIPVEPPASIALEALHIVAEGGGSPVAQMMAEDYVMTEMLGEEGYAALRGCKTLKSADLRRVIEVCSERANAAMEEEGNPNR